MSSAEHIQESGLGKDGPRRTDGRPLRKAAGSRRLQALYPRGHFPNPAWENVGDVVLSYIRGRTKGAGVGLSIPNVGNLSAAVITSPPLLLHHLVPHEHAFFVPAETPRVPMMPSRAAQRGQPTRRRWPVVAVAALLGLVTALFLGNLSWTMSKEKLLILGGFYLVKLAIGGYLLHRLRRPDVTS